MATVNVQSIKDLMDMVINIMHAWDLDILVLLETWLRGEEADALAASMFYGSNGARVFSTVAPDTENRHLGVTLILGSQMARHYQSMVTVEGTANRVKLRWRRTELHIIAVHLPSAEIMQKPKRRWIRSWAGYTRPNTEAQMNRSTPSCSEI